MVKALLMTTKRIAGIVLILSISGWINQTEPSEKINESCAAFNQIQIDIRDNVISPDSARTAFRAVMMDLRSQFKRDTCQGIDSSYFVYPVYGLALRPYASPVACSLS